MDPLSIIAGTTGTVAFAITSAAMLNNFINNILDAPADIAAIGADVNALTKILNTLQGWLEKDVIKPSAAESLVPALNSCVTSMNQLRLVIQPYTKLNPDNRPTLKWRSFGWTFKKQEIRDLRDKLQHGKTTLSISIGIINTYAIESGNQELSKQIESGNDAIRGDISNLHQDIRYRKERKVDLASVGGERGSRFNGTDAGIPLRRYLEDLSPMSHPWAGASEIGDILSLRSIDDGESRPPTRPASPGVIVEEPLSLLQIRSPLHRATEEDDIRKVMELLKAGADVNEKGIDGKTPLHVCAQANNTVMAEVLLYKSASVRIVDKAGKEPLRTALESGSAEMAFMLISRGSPLNALSDFMMDEAQPQRTAQKPFLLRCLGCVFDEGKEDEFMEVLSVSMQGASESSESALLELLHDAEAGHDIIGFGKLVADRRFKSKLGSSEKAEDLNHESDVDVTAANSPNDSRSAGEAGGSEHEQELGTPTSTEENHARSLESVVMEKSGTDEPSQPDHSGISAATIAMEITREPGTEATQDVGAQAENVDFAGNDRGMSGDHAENGPSLTKSESLGGLTSTTKDSKDLSGSAFCKTESDVDTPGTSELEVAKIDHPHFFLHKQFSWEIAMSHDTEIASKADEKRNPEHNAELSDVPMPSRLPPLPPPPTRPVFGVALQELCDDEQVRVPRIVCECISITEQFASDVSDMYNHVPHPAYLRFLKESAHRGSSIQELTRPDDVSHYEHAVAVAALLKDFLRELPESLLPQSLHDTLMELAQEEKALLGQQLRCTIYALPIGHYATLRAVMVHLRKRVDDREQELREGFSAKARPDNSDWVIRKIISSFAPLLLHPAKSAVETQADGASRDKIVHSILYDCHEFLQDEDYKLNVPNDLQAATRLSLGFTVQQS